MTDPFDLVAADIGLRSRKTLLAAARLGAI
jgi:hypothetical protein